MFGPEWTGAGRVTLEIKGKVIPGFKNNKMLIVKNQRGAPLPRPLLITRPDLQKQMTQIVASFESQLLSAYRIAAAETLTECSLLSWIASFVPEDDCLTQVPEIHIRAEMCEPGEEGATVTIERL